VTTARFPRTLRLIKPDDYRRTFRRGRRVGDSLFTIVAARSNRDHARLGLAIARKAARRAVDRNRLKRIVRETFRHEQARLAGWDLVVLARPAAVTAPNDVLHRSLVALWQRLAGC
jgi:ribonuclease P protein component